MKRILGINAYHGDASACLLVNGELVAAVEEERFLRLKHWAGVPKNSVAYCLKEAGLSLNDIDVIAINTDPKANYFKKIMHVLQHRVSITLIRDRLRNAKSRDSIVKSMEDFFPLEKFDGMVFNVEHHLAHLASAFYVSPYEKSAVVSVDGFGDFSSGAWGLGDKKNISIKKFFNYPHSLGAFYQAITQFLGFYNYGDEYKVMGLAPYGVPRYIDEMRKIVILGSDGSYKLNLKYFKFHKKKVAYEWEDGSPVVGKLYSDELERLLGSSRKESENITQVHKDIAASCQAMFESALFNLLNTVQEATGSDNLCLAGGCGNNSVANGKIRANTKFKNIYVAASAGDAGGAIGAALFAHYALSSDPRSTHHMDHAYWGPSFDNDNVEDTLDKYRDLLNEREFYILKTTTLESLTNHTVHAICDGKVVGWFQGRMEWGPRALGNRSILGDPRRRDMKDILNQKIKRRESFRPFAPSVLREYVSEWFEEDDDVPFMMKVFKIKPEKRAQIPAVVHVDGTGRLQTVNLKTNARYHALITKFYNLTGIPMVLNTSFNENEPIVCNPEEALNCFLRTKMDVLVLNDYMVFRNE